MNKRAFALIELMIVVAIISILAAIAIPQFFNIYYKAKNKERSRRGLPPLKDPTEIVGTNDTPPSCSGKPISVTVDSYYIYKLYDSGCTEKTPK